MALIRCPECNQEISDKATICPHCGFPLQKEFKKQEKQEKLKEEFVLQDMVIAHRSDSGSAIVRFAIEFLCSLVFFVIVLAFMIWAFANGNLGLGISLSFSLVFPGIPFFLLLIAAIVGFVYVGLNKRNKNQCMTYCKDTNKICAYTICGKEIELDPKSIVKVRDNIHTYNMLKVYYDNGDGKQVLLRLGFCSDRERIKDRIERIQEGK